MQAVASDGLAQSIKNSLFRADLERHIQWAKTHSAGKQHNPTQNKQDNTECAADNLGEI
jgi:hypothetical protein